MRKDRREAPLKTLQCFFTRELRQLGALLLDKPGGLTGSEERVKLPHCIGTRRVHGSKGHHIGRIATGISRGVGEVAMLGIQSVPHRIHKKYFPAGCHSPEDASWSSCSRLAGLHAQFFTMLPANFIIAIPAAKCDPRDADRKDAETIEWL